jgi:multimeric flavodoxin WrbA/putative sterol carrier protein
MDAIEKRKSIVENLTLQNNFFNPKKSPSKDLDFQFEFNEPEDHFQFYFSVREKASSLIEGVAAKPVCTVVTDFETWNKIGGGYISPPKAMAQGNFKIKGNFLTFLFRFRKMYSGNINWQMPGNLYRGTYPIPYIRKVLVLSCSPRVKTGATYLMVERMVAGMEKAGADVEVLFPSKMKINPCIGCFKCWVNNTKECIYHEKDDMKIILEKYHEVDLVVWATPVYHYHGTTAMKTVMDRLFINSDPHFIEVDGQYRHPRKWERIPYYAILSVGGFPKMDIFEPIQSTFKILAKHTGMKIIAELYRHTSMFFLIEGIKMKKKDEILESMEKAGFEMIKYQKVNKKTKKIIEQEIIDLPMIVSSVNYKMNIMQQEKTLPFKRITNCD